MAAEKAETVTVQNRRNLGAPRTVIGGCELNQRPVTSTGRFSQRLATGNRVLATGIFG